MFDRQGQRKYLNQQERQACLNVFMDEPDPCRRAFSLTLFHTGCRISEALSLTVEGIDFPQKCLVFETLKRRERGIFRAVPIPDSLLSLLKGLTGDADPLSRVWNISRSTAYRKIRHQMVQSGIKRPRASPRGLRHGFGVACVAQKIPTPILQKWLGHARMESTAIYMAVVDDEERDLARRLWSQLKK